MTSNIPLKVCRVVVLVSVCFKQKHKHKVNRRNLCFCWCLSFSRVFMAVIPVKVMKNKVQWVKRITNLQQKKEERKKKINFVHFRDLCFRIVHDLGAINTDKLNLKAT